MVPRKRKGANDTVERTDAYWAVYQRAEGAWIEPRGFAYSIGMSRTYFAEAETDKRNISIENIDRIAKGLGISLREFFDSELFV